MYIENYKQDFTKWIEEENIKVLQSLPNIDFEIGDVVDFTNDYGVTFEEMEILGFRENCSLLPENVVFLNKSSYWFAVKLNSIKIIN